jgi:hypothetical protein
MQRIIERLHKIGSVLEVCHELLVGGQSSDNSLRRAVVQCNPWRSRRFVRRVAAFPGGA